MSKTSSHRGTPQNTPVRHPLKTALQQDHKGLWSSALTVVMQMIHHLKAVKRPGSPCPACAAAPPAVPLGAKRQAPPRTAAPRLAGGEAGNLGERPVAPSAVTGASPRLPAFLGARVWNTGLEHGLAADAQPVLPERPNPRIPRARSGRSRDCGCAASGLVSEWAGVCGRRHGWGLGERSCAGWARGGHSWVTLCVGLNRTELVHVFYAARLVLTLHSV